MTVPSSGLLAFTQSILNTTLANTATNVSNPPTTGTLGTSQVFGGVAYPLTYGTESRVLASPGTYPAYDGWMAVGANAPASGLNSINGFTPIGAAQGNSQNQCGNRSTGLPIEFNLLIAQLLTMANYTYRI